MKEINNAGKYNDSARNIIACLVAGIFAKKQHSRSNRALPFADRSHRVVSCVRVGGELSDYVLIETLEVVSDRAVQSLHHFSSFHGLNFTQNDMQTVHWVLGRMLTMRTMRHSLPRCYKPCLIYHPLYTTSSIWSHFPFESLR